ncbi:MAG: hypothetical protein KBT36_16400 [Kurthia sp.]|nr:hypothetical protein [Candidatus Kurthia equi]
MATKSTNPKEVIWSLVAVITAIISVAYCIQLFLESSSVNITTIFAKLKMLGANYIG